MKTAKFFLCILTTITISCQNLERHEPQVNIESIDYESHLDSLGIILPPPTAPVANYVNIVQSGNLLFLSGKGPKMTNGQYIVGTLGKDLIVEQGYQAAKRVAEIQIGVLSNYLGDLNKVKRVVKVLGLVRSTDDFGDQPEVMNGFSDTMVAVFGDKGKHARAAIGTNSLPRNICLEIEMIVEVY